MLEAGDIAQIETLENAETKMLQRIYRLFCFLAAVGPNQTITKDELFNLWFRGDPEGGPLSWDNYRATILMRARDYLKPEWQILTLYHNGIVLTKGAFVHDPANRRRTFSASRQGHFAVSSKRNQADGSSRAK